MVECLNVRKTQGMRPQIWRRKIVRADVERVWKLIHTPQHLEWGYIKPQLESYLDSVLRGIDHYLDHQKQFPKIILESIGGLVELGFSFKLRYIGV